MTGLPTLDPEIADLGLAIGLLAQGDSGVELDSDWFGDPAALLSGVLADDGRRAAMVRFAEAVLAAGEHNESGGVTLLHLFDLRTLAPGTDLPDLTIKVSLDANPADYIEIGLAVFFSTEDPATTTDVRIPLYRAAKAGRSVAQPFALLAGGLVHLSTDLTLSSQQPAVDEFGLAGVSIGLDTALTAGATPQFQLVLKDLHLPGAATSQDLTIGGAGQDLEQTLLSLVLGLVRQSADSLAGPAGADVQAALSLLGLGAAAGIPPLPVAELLSQGPSRLRDWFTAIMGSPTARDAWLAVLAELLHGSLSSGLVKIPIPGGRATAELEFAAQTGPSGHLVVTPRLTVRLSTDVAGAVRLGAEATADLFTIDTANAAMQVLPNAEIAVTATGAGVKLVDTNNFAVGAVRLGLTLDHGVPRALVQLLDVDLDGHPYEQLDLSNPDAVVAAAGQVAATLLADALDALGGAGAELKGLLGLVPTGAMPALNGVDLLSNPLGALAQWWRELLTVHPSEVPAVLTRLRNLVAGPAQITEAISVVDAAVGPWSVPIIDHLRLDLALVDGVLVVEPVVSLLVDDLGGGCTEVRTEVRVRLAALDLAGPRATFPLQIDLTVKLRASGGTEARLALGPVAIAADFIGLQAGWSPDHGLAVQLLAPGLAIDTGVDRIPLVLPTVDAAGHIDVPAEAWNSVEALFGVLAANAPLGWFSDLVDLTGWTLSGGLTGPRLSLQSLVAAPGPTLTAWLRALVTDADLLGSLTSTIAHLLGGSLDGLAGSFSGSGTPVDPWLAALTPTGTGPALSVWMAPHGPVLAASVAGQALTGWRPGMPGLPPDGLAQALFDEARAGADVAALAAGRDGIAVGLAALVGRWVGTDGLVAPPPDPIEALTVVRCPDLDHTGLASLQLDTLVNGGLPANAVVVRVAITSASDPAWTTSAGRLLDLTTPGVAPASFTVAAPATGDWVVALAPRADATLGGVDDPTGLVGQAQRLENVLRSLATAGPVVLVALGGAGHAARMAADAVAGVTHLITLGTPWSPVTFDSARTGVPADAVRLLRALLPPPDPAEHDDADLALGRQLVDGFMAAARGVPFVTDLEAPRPQLPVRTGLSAVAVFGVLEDAAVARALTAVFAAGLSGRAQARVAEANALPESTRAALRVPFDLLLPPGGHGVTVTGAVSLTLGEVSAASAGLVLELTVADTDGWLIGGPGVVPSGGALPLELRRLSARIEIALHGGESSAQLTLQEGSALGADFSALLAAPPGLATGELETKPILPEAQALVAAVTAKLAAVPTGPAQLLSSLFSALAITQPGGALVPDALLHLLHDPRGHVAALAAQATSRTALLDALAAIVPGMTVTGDSVRVASGPVTVAADLAARTVGFTAAANDGLLACHATVDFDSSGRPTAAFGLGDPVADAFALSIETAPLRVQLLRPPGVPPIALLPTLDLDGLAKLAMTAVPAEATRILLEGLRRIDRRVGLVLEALTDALGMLKAADAQGFRAMSSPVGLFEDPARWFREAGKLSVVSGGPLDADKVINLFESLKPFLGFVASPRGQWPIVNGVTVTATPGSSGPVLSLAVDVTSWLALPASVAAGFTAGLTLSGTSPSPSIEVYFGVPDGPAGTTTPQHRRAAHLLVGGGALRLILRPATGADVELYPNTAGLGALLQTGVVEVLPRALTELAALSGDAVRTEIGELVGAMGRGLALAAGTPAVFDSTALKALAADPPAYLRARLASLLTESVAALDPLLVRLLDLPAGEHAAVLSGAGVLTVDIGAARAVIHANPLAVSVSASVTGLPVIDAVDLTMDLDATGLTGWSAGVGPATIDLDGPIVRPFVRAGSDAGSGWEIQVGLGLDALSPTTAGHRELAGRWRQADGLSVLVSTRTNTGDVAQDTNATAVALAAISAVLDLVGGWVLGVQEIQDLLDKAVGTGGLKVKDVLEGSILTDDVPPRLLPDVLSGWPGKLLTLADEFATAAPKVTVGQFEFGAANTDGVLGVSLSTSDQAGIDLTPDGELSLRLVVDASWIEPPTGPRPSPGIVLDLLRVNGAGIEPAPGIAINGVGLRLGKSTGPLVDAGLKLETVALHLFGSIVLGGGGVPDLAGGVHVELGGLAVPLGSGGGENAVAKGIMRDAGGSGAPPRPAFSPALAVQDHGTGVAITLQAGQGDGPWFLPIQRAFGPVYLEQVGLGVAYRQNLTPRQLEMVSLYLDGQVSLLGLTAAVEKLRLSYHVSRPLFSPTSWEVDVDGFAIAASFGPLTLAGGLVKFPLDAPLSGVEYLGMLQIGYGTYRVDMFGGYAHPTAPGGEEFASFFAFGVLHAPIGGPPAFFVTGIAVGFGINRALHTPTIDEIGTHPFMQALRAFGPPPEPMRQLQDMRAIVPAARGEYWVAAGLSFTSFVLVTGEILVTVQFGDGLEIAVLGLARALLPTPVLTLVSIELALLARFSTKEGLLLVQAQLTENSWLLDKSVRLTGGFAFETWWKGPNAGQFVITVGGYHPRFHHDGYPEVPRVGLRWQPNGNIKVEGGVYFALCSEAIMAGASMHVAAHLGPAHASLDFGGDGIVFFDPFFFDIDVYAEARVGITIWLLFGSIDIDVSLGFDVNVSGPPIHVEGHFSICGVGIPFSFGDRADPAERALSAGDFAQKYLRGEKDAQVVQAAVIRGALTAGTSGTPNSGGVAKPPDGSADLPFRVVPEFQMTFVTTVPSQQVALTSAAGSHAETVATPGLGVAPMYAATMNSTLTVKVTSDVNQAFSLDAVRLTLRPAAQFPKGVWGPAQNPDAKTIPAGDTVNGCDGFTVDTRLPDSLFTGAKPINYHQVELPLAGRKPLPFITNRGQTDGRVAEAKALKDAAKVLVAGSPGADQRFVRAALVLDAAGNGRTTVAALRGERAAAPTFGSLADDLVDSPDAVSTEVTAVVDRSPTPPRRVPPMVKSVLGVPMTLTLDRPVRTTVRDRGTAVPLAAPRLATVQAASVGQTQMALHLIPRRAQAAGPTLSAVGVTPLTRLASEAVGAVANAAPTPAAQQRLAAMSAGLVAGLPKTGKSTKGGAILHDGELAVVTIANRPTGKHPDVLSVTGGVLTRVLCLAAGGQVLDDRIVGSEGPRIDVELPMATERVIVVGLGQSAALGGSFAGWYAGQSLPALGWGAALGDGVVVTAQGSRVPGNRERGDGGWVSGRELATAARVVTAFTDPVGAVAVVIDDQVGGDAAAEVSINLADAVRSLDATGTPQPPRVLVDGVRTILIYAVETEGPNPRVSVEGCGTGQLAGVLGTSVDAVAMAESLARSGIAAAVRQPLVGGPGDRQVSIALGDDTADDKPSKTAKKVTKKVAKKAVKKAAKKPAKKAAKKGARR
ncbi:hypothetical protein EV645_6489 [Kribbella rubisoli]|uniref:DUF6603 domain-containing protein n=1 Tax=Kribbella rubisoli TaxID=3075929 RepID=A0A4Q7WMH3_9ACTN|nr:DUF6603 domain-containing protein [Kribbella rubisoli]RZU11327.1 hypothetical protein EV645_6489 [Kribbella rubisoli]